MFGLRFKREIVAIVFLVVASLCLVAALISCIYVQRFLARAVRTPAIVTQVNSRKDDHGTFYYPVFKFGDMHGVEHIIVANVGDSREAFSPGDNIQILYDPLHPEDARIGSFFSIWLIPIILGSIGAVYLPLSIVLFYWPRILNYIRR